MQTDTLSRTDAAAVSRLLIHAPGQDDSDGWSVDSLIQRMRSHVLERPRGERPLLALEIHDLQGQRLLALDDACPLVEVTLPAGTYHVSTDLAGARRSYTVALERGASFDLYLRLSRDGARDGERGWH
jgi:hypothetical protein